LQPKAAAKPALPKETAAKAAAPPVVKESPKEPPKAEPTGPLTWAQRAAKDANRSKATEEVAKRAPAAPAVAAVSKVEAKAPPHGKAEPVAKASKAESGKAVMDPLSLYVKGLPEGTTESQLRAVFGGYGEIKSVR